ncbi:uncharacterized protein LOC107267087 [Cephus cinctus]|uniref:Uncharacterized protein LOC107267087 n=1 Tax=Cephus cinctus TaxID=211228 RepID=A0AAJ7BTA1_CEPCN|nr:uncharacterized protein LOC107267087 [Cephus cinctus]
MELTVGGIISFVHVALILFSINAAERVMGENSKFLGNELIQVRKDSRANQDLSQLEGLSKILKQASGNSSAGGTQVTATRQGPCQCASGVCGCCSRILLNTLNQKACVNITYDPDEFSFTANILMNDRILYTRTVSGKNPRPFCVPVPRIPIVRACVRLYNVYFQGRNVHACVNMEGKFRDTTVFKIGLDCIRLGANGVAVVKPEDGGGLGQIQFLPGDDDDNDDYDEEDDDDDDDDDEEDEDDDDDDDDDILDF